MELVGILVVIVVISKIYTLIVNGIANIAQKNRDKTNDIVLKATYADMKHKAELHYEKMMRNEHLEPQTMPVPLENSSYIPKEKYMEYLMSNKWKTKRLERLKIDNYECQYCGSEVRSNTDEYNTANIHHLNYRRLTNENVEEDLITLCSYCHNSLHEKYSIRHIENIFLELRSYKNEKKTSIFGVKY